MELDRNQKTLVGIVILALMVTGLVVLPNYLTATEPTVCTVNGECQHEKALNDLIALTPVILFAGVVLGVLSLYFFYERKKPAAAVIEAKTDAASEDGKRSLIDLVDVLDEAEAKVMRKIITEKGRVLQAEISRLEGVGKVKAHRVIERLEKRGLIEVEGAGKTNIIKLTEKYRKLFLDNC